MSGLLAMLAVGGASELRINISNTVNPNIASLLSAAGWDGLKHVKLIVDPSAMVNTLVIPNTAFPGGLALEVGAGALIGGTPSGHAISTPVPISILNQGAIKGGGGRGGTGGNASVTRYGQTAYGSGGAGGIGQGFAAGTLTVQAAAYPQDGTEGTVGDGTSFGPGDSGYAKAIGGRGGVGGNWRQSGYAGGSGRVSGTYSASSVTPGASGQPPGQNINGEHLVTWIVRGDA